MKFSTSIISMLFYFLSSCSKRSLTTTCRYHQSGVGVGVGVTSAFHHDINLIGTRTTALLVPSPSFKTFSTTTSPLSSYSHVSTCRSLFGNNNGSRVGRQQQKQHVVTGTGGYIRDFSSSSSSNGGSNNNKNGASATSTSSETENIRTRTTSPNDSTYLNQLEKERKERLTNLLFPNFYETDYRLYVDEKRSNFHNTGILLPQDLKMHQRIIALGDVHGDLSALIGLLVSARVMDVPNTMEDALENPKWIGGDTILVQIGDILDRGPNELACIRLLSSLSRQALQSNGMVVCLYGNHEVLNAVGLFQYADPSGNLEFEMTIGKTLDGPERYNSNRWRMQYAGNEPCRWTTFEPGTGLLVQNLLQNFKVATQIGRNVFVHAGITKDHLLKMGGIKGMNEQAKDWINQKHHLHNIDGDYDSVEDVLEAAKQRAKIQHDTMPECLGGGIGSPSPVWMRDYSQPSDVPPRNSPKAQHMINEALETVGNGAMRMIMGHTPQSQINAALGGKAWRIDIGASRGVSGNKPEVLEIIHGGGDLDGMTDSINILTIDGKRISGNERFVVGNDHLTYFE